MGNQDTAAAMRFHNRSKYNWSLDDAGRRVEFMGEPLDIGPQIGEQEPALEPVPFKVYTNLDLLPLPADFPEGPVGALEAISATGPVTGETGVLDLSALARLLQLSNGILKRGSHRPGGREIEYRTSGGTGARYHLELYVVCGDLPDLSAGVYHYDAKAHGLRQLRAGDYRAVLVHASGGEPAVAQAPATILLTSTFWRNAWRYLERAYRHTFWDSGTTLTNLLAVSASANLPAELVLGFVDTDVNGLLDIDGQREAATALVAIGSGSPVGETSPAVTPLGLPTQRISPAEIDFPRIWEMQAASSLTSADAVRDWRGGPVRHPLPPAGGPVIPLTPLDPADWPSKSIDAVIRGRRSTRHYTEEPIPFAALSTLLDVSTRGVAGDCLDPSVGSLHDTYLIVNAVEGLEPGAYVYHRDERALELLRPGNFRGMATDLACEQEYAGAAHVNLYCLTNLEPVLARFGNRGYRLAQLEAALWASKLHIATHGLGLGAVGSTSFDNDVIRFFSPHAAGKSYMFILTFGQKAKRLQSA